ncbi:MAG: long-chain fatty acid--CoA ligase [Paludibacteraceae bacterium]|nr:long-chain fatty acid--CoA ligase [Paludibacteraceae bacterium]
MEIERIFDLITYAKENYGEDHKVFGFKKDKKWATVSAKEYGERADAVSKAFLEMGYGKGDKVAIISSSRPEWNISDMGVLQFGGVSIPIYPTISAHEYEYIFRHSEAKVVIVENKHLLSKIQETVQSVESIEKVITIDKVDDEHTTLDELMTLGRQSQKDEALENAKKNVSANDLATLIYTSGTTGLPKGVMLSHSNFVNQVKHLKEIPDKRVKRALSFLPLCHVYERMMVYLYQRIGATTYYAENMATIMDNLKEVNPQMTTCVPRLLEKIQEKLIGAGKSLKGISKKIYYWAVDVAKSYDLDEQTVGYRIKHKIADKLIYKKWRAALGGDFDIVVSGGSSINPILTNFFNAIGWPIFEGYGMSETSPVIAVSEKWPKARKAGSVGPALPGVDIKISPENNEICCRGHNVMMGYYKDDAKTKEAIDEDGWFHTGDTGRFDKYKRLYITGRIKSLFKTSMGKYINPEILEQKYCESPLIDQMMVVGENKNFAAALVVPNFDNLREAAAKNGIETGTNIEMANDPKINRLVADDMKKYDKFFGDWEHIKKIKLISDEWNQESGFITPTLKLKRNVISDRYEHEIEELFS